MTMSKTVYPLLLLMTLFDRASFSQEWPQFRGPTGDGHAAMAPVQTSWSETENVTWKTELPGKGWSSPVISGDSIWMTTAVENENGPVDLHALCVSRKSGKLLHNVKLFVQMQPEKIHAMNSYASPTPVIAGNRVFCHFGNYGTACLDVESGVVQWKINRFAYTTQNGPGASPVAWNGLLLFNCDGTDLQYAVALRQETGATVWKVKRSGELNSNPEMKKSYATPSIVKTKNGDILVSPAADWVYAYEPSSGREIWKANYGKLGFSCVPKPVFQEGTAYVLTSFMKSRLLAIDFSGKGDISKSGVRWKSDSNMPSKPSLLIVGKNLYAINDKGVLSCLDAQTGKEKYRQRIGGSFAASPLFAGGHVYLFDTQGRTTVFKPGDKYEMVKKNELEGKFMASAAVAGKSLFLRTDKAFYRID
ncbi:MAG: PQQ-binding-like beta-propeller repeat protein [Planctomycetota bacterium]|nr:PQQ-binding-like beta-propeller repeat protein [Planctomycetota bacterium]